MRRKVLLTLLALVATALWAGTSGAVITGTAHDTGIVNSPTGPCAACHIPHGGGASRLWASTAGTETVVGVVAPLCTTCHTDTGGYSATMAAANLSEQYVFATTSHAQLMGQDNPPWGTAVGASGLDYAAQATNFECTTCHDVHNDTNRPFLRDAMNALCARCHTDRHFVGGTDSSGGTVTAGSWGAGNYGTANPGAHPVGDDVTTDSSGGTTPINIPAVMSVASSPAQQWSLGGKRHDLTATGGVTCVTCHAAHGIHWDPDDGVNASFAGSNAQPYVNFLSVEQLSVAAAWTDPGGGQRSVANGDGGTNTLCEACHGSATMGGSAYAGGFTPNPGDTANYTHPTDDMDSNVDAGVTGFPANWPEGGGFLLGTNVAPSAPICESCHVPHPAAEIADGRADVNAGASAYMLRNAYNGICEQCHGAGFSNHHPVGMGFNSSGLTLTNVTGAGGDTLTCTSCHSESGAHNWTGSGFVGLDSNWLPADNGRSAAQATDMYNSDMSKTCMDCHYGMDGDRNSVSPTMGTLATVTLETEFQTVDDSMGTHYIGLINNAGSGTNNWEGNGVPDANGNIPVVPLVDIFNTSSTWTADTDMDNAGAGWSRFGGTAIAPVLVCESCHELEPDKNVDTQANPSHLLLSRYGESADGDTDGDGDGLDELCMACHGIPNGTHQTTGWIVSRTGLALDTGSSYLRSGAPIGDATFSTTDELSCDGCHQPHDANSNSYTFILEGPESAPAPLPNPIVGLGSVDGAEPEATTDYPTSTGSVGTYATPTLSGRGGDYTAYCDQCHAYAY